MADAASTATRETGAPTRSLAGWRGDLWLAIRAVARYPLFAGVVIGTLALSIGGVTAVFMLADPMLFRPLPYADPDRILIASVRGPRTFGGYSLFADYFQAQQARSFAAVGAFYGPVVGRIESAPDDDSNVLGYAVTGGFFDVFGVTPAIGRLFTQDDYAAASTTHGGMQSGQPAVITDGLWQRAFGRRADILGQSLRLTVRGRLTSRPIIGVLRPDFRFPDATNEAPQFLLAGRLDAAQPAGPGSNTDVMVRLAPGATRDQATAEFQQILVTTARQFPKVSPERKVRFLGVRDALFTSVRTPLLMLLAVTGGILLLASANLAHLSLARTSDRARELAVRRALGASGWRIFRLLFTEALVLALCGGIGALGVGRGLLAAVMAVMPRFARVYRLMPAVLDSRTVLAATALTLGTLLAFGIAPAVQAVRPRIVGALQGTSIRTRRGRRLQDNVLMALQAGLAVSVLVVSTLIVVSFVKLGNTVQGIDLGGLTSLGVELPTEYFTTPARGGAFYRDFSAQFAATTGVRLGMSSGTPGVTLPGGLWRAADEPGANAPAQVIAYPADRAYIDTIRLQLVRGRLYDDREALGNAPVAVVDERAAASLWPGQDPLGQLVRDRQSPTGPTRAVVGVVRTIDLDFGAKPDAPGGGGTAFVPFDPAGRTNYGFVWRGTVTPAFKDAARQLASRLDPRSVVSTSPLEPFERSLGEPRLMARLLGVLGLLALILTVAGVYSVVSHTIAGRTAEIGVRMALGATTAGVRRMIVREAVIPAAAGIGLGVVFSLWWTETIRKLLFALTPRDPWMFALATVLILGVVVIASVIPARRASRVDPIVALRVE
jgi:predicted permease